MNGPPFNIQNGVKQGDPLSSLLFTSMLEKVFENLRSLSTNSIVVGSKRLNNQTAMH